MTADMPRLKITISATDTALSVYLELEGVIFSECEIDQRILALSENPIQRAMVEVRGYAEAMAMELLRVEGERLASHLENEFKTITGIDIAGVY